MDYTVALRILDYLQQEDEYLPWQSALFTLSRVRALLKRTPIFGHFKVCLYQMVNKSDES